jgi:peptidoglycan/LPS O-acetylase OafA/YrhL
LAITAIVLFHFHVRDGQLIPGGYFGVDVFFALSGFLVTSVLLEEHAQTGAVALRSFFRRRAGRLLPALGVFLAIWLVAALVFGDSGWFNVDPFGPRRPGPHLDPGVALRGAAWSFVCAINWLKVLHHETPLLLGHLWYVAVQEQFYVAWAIVLALTLRWSRRVTLGLALAGIVASFAASLLLWHGGAGADHVYFGTDSRAQGPLIGAVAALLWQRGHLRPIPRGVRAGLALVGTVVLGLLLFHFSGDVIKFRGGFALASVATICVITYLADTPTNAVTAVLRWRPLVWLGRRSYAIYLWHYPFACWTHRLPDRVGLPLGLAATGVTAELSWRLVESRRRPSRPAWRSRS